MAENWILYQMESTASTAPHVEVVGAEGDNGVVARAVVIVGGNDGFVVYIEDGFVIDAEYDVMIDFDVRIALDVVFDEKSDRGEMAGVGEEDEADA